MRIKHVFLLGLVIILPGSPVGPRSAISLDVEELLSSMSRNLEELKAIQGTFRQDVEMTLMEEKRSYHGRIYSMYPDLLRLEYDDPAGQLLICDGTWFWMYLTDQDRPQVFKTAVGEGVGGFLSATILSFLKDSFRGRLEGIEDVEGVPCYKIFFAPPMDETTYQIDNLFLWVSTEDHLSRKLSYEDLAGNRIAYHFFGLRKAESLPGHLFSFTPSPDVDIFEDLLSP